MIPKKVNEIDCTWIKSFKIDANTENQLESFRLSKKSQDEFFGNRSKLYAYNRLSLKKSDFFWLFTSIFSTEAVHSGSRSLDKMNALRLDKTIYTNTHKTDVRCGRSHDNS